VPYAGSGYSDLTPIANGIVGFKALMEGGSLKSERGGP
jgi:hypothetical protein